MKTGQVIGSTNRFAEEAADRPVDYKEVLVTLYNRMGIDIRETPVVDSLARPHYLFDGFEPIRELI